MVNKLKKVSAWVLSLMISVICIVMVVVTLAFVAALAEKYLGVGHNSAVFLIGYLTAILVGPIEAFIRRGLKLKQSVTARGE